MTVSVKEKDIVWPDKIDRRYVVSMEIAGDAYFGIPSAFRSYPAPTNSAVIGMFKSIMMLRSAVVIPLKVEICSPINYRSMATNYRGPLRCSTTIKKDASDQSRIQFLTDACYKLYAAVMRSDIPVEQMSPAAQHQFEQWGTKKSRPIKNGAHAYQCMFERRLANGQFFRVPTLGISEFLPSYVGPLREETQPDESINMTVRTMLYHTFSNFHKGQYKPEYRQNVKIEKGVMHYA